MRFHLKNLFGKLNASSCTEAIHVARRQGWLGGSPLRVGNSTRHFKQLDSYVRERLALFVRKKTGRSGRGWARHNLAFFQRLGVYCLTGTVGWATATPRAGR